MSLETLTHKVHLAKLRGWKTDQIFGQLTKDETCLSIILYGVSFVSNLFKSKFREIVYANCKGLKSLETEIRNL